MLIVGVRESEVVEQDGGPLALATAGANVNDHKLLEETIEAIVIERPDPTEVVQHLCLDKAYDKKPENYEGLVQLACALLWFRRLERVKRRERVFG